MVTSLLTLALMALPDQCPPHLTPKRDGLCYYNIRYLEERPQTGLQKPFKVSRDGFSPKAIELGRLLFFDPALSGTGEVSCAHCHRPDRGLADGRARSRIGRHELKRGAPSLWNVAFLSSYFWDARVGTLEEQAKGPLFSKEEMANTPQKLEQTLNAIPTYRTLFKEAFGVTRIETSRVIEALATFQRTLVSFSSRYDDYAFGAKTALTPQEDRGFQVFRSFVTRCTECHTPPLFTNQQVAIIGAPDSAKPVDLGTGNGAFRVPSLRNVARTAPYMHSGGFTQLIDVVNFYNLGAGRGPRGISHPQTHWHIRSMGLSPTEEQEMVAFLGSLTDESTLPSVPERVPSGLPILKGDLE